MREEKSCGCIIIDGGKVLCEKQKSIEGPFWNFPKGHVEAGETNIETALREVKEEVGLEVEIIDEEPLRMDYLVHNNTPKTVLIFIARLKDGTKREVTLQEGEVEEVRWLTPDEVEEILTFEAWKNIFREAREREAFKKAVGGSV